MIKTFYLISLFLLSGQAFACPTCMSDPETGKTYLIVIWTFIALIYIPFFILFRSIIKNKNINKTVTTENSENKL